MATALPVRPLTILRAIERALAPRARLQVFALIAARTTHEIEEALSFYGINDEDKNPEDRLDIDALFDDLDDDLDGVVTYSEFKGAFLDLVRDVKKTERERKRARKAKRKSRKARLNQANKVLPMRGMEEV